MSVCCYAVFNTVSAAEVSVAVPVEELCKVSGPAAAAFMRTVLPAAETSVELVIVMVSPGMRVPLRYKLMSRLPVVTEPLAKYETR